MTMRIVFLKDHEDKKAETEHFIDRKDAIKLCETGIAVPANLFEKILAKRAEKKEKADAQKKAELLKQKEKAEAEKAESKKPKMAEKAVENNIK